MERSVNRQRCNESVVHSVNGDGLFEYADDNIAVGDVAADVAGDDSYSSYVTYRN